MSFLKELYTDLFSDVVFTDEIIENLKQIKIIKMPVISENQEDFIYKGVNHTYDKTNDFKIAGRYYVNCSVTYSHSKVIRMMYDAVGKVAPEKFVNYMRKHTRDKKIIQTNVNSDMKSINKDINDLKSLLSLTNDKEIRIHIESKIKQVEEYKNKIILSYCSDVSKKYEL